MSTDRPDAADEGAAVSDWHGLALSSGAQIDVFGADGSGEAGVVFGDAGGGRARVSLSDATQMAEWLREFLTLLPASKPGWPREKRADVPPKPQGFSALPYLVPGETLFVETDPDTGEPHFVTEAQRTAQARAAREAAEDAHRAEVLRLLGEIARKLPEPMAPLTCDGGILIPSPPGHGGR